MQFGRVASRRKSVKNQRSNSAGGDQKWLGERQSPQPQNGRDFYRENKELSGLRIPSMECLKRPISEASIKVNLILTETLEIPQMIAVSLI